MPITIQPLRRRSFLPELEHIMLHPPYRRYDELPPLELLPLPYHRPNAEPVETLLAGHSGYSSHYPVLSLDNFLPAHSSSNASNIRSVPRSSLKYERTRSKREPRRERTRKQLHLSNSSSSQSSICGSLKNELHRQSYEKVPTGDAYFFLPNGYVERASSAASQLSSDTPQMASGLSGEDNSDPEGSGQNLLQADKPEAPCAGSNLSAKSDIVKKTSTNASDFAEPWNYHATGDYFDARRSPRKLSSRLTRSPGSDKHVSRRCHSALSGLHFDDESPSFEAI
jgi:hypothetical protein